jgi:hypothetical protein
MFRVLFLKNDSANSEESFIDTKTHEDLTPEKLQAVVRDAGEYIVRRFNEGEKWTAEVVQVISKIVRTGGDESGDKKQNEKAGG